MTAYYNENDPKAAAWLKELIKAGLIAAGDVDERSIEDVTPDEIKHYTQAHFFAGIGVWSYALRQAGWPDDRPVWTGSCPCQPFSAAGKRGGTADERHLWPAWEYLIAQCKPPVVFGEQVASKDGLGWLDTVQTDLEGQGYAFGANDICAAGVGAPHIRQRSWFVAERVADADDSRPQGRCQRGNGADQRAAGSTGLDGRLGDSDSNGSQQGSERPKANRHGDTINATCGIERLADSGRTEPQGWEHEPADKHRCRGKGQFERNESAPHGDDNRPNPTNGLWADVDWLGCRDGKWRPVEPGTFPLVNGAPARVGRLRGYGNAINAEVARLFIESYIDYRKTHNDTTL